MSVKDQFCCSKFDEVLKHNLIYQNDKTEFNFGIHFAGANEGNIISIPFRFCPFCGSDTYTWHTPTGLSIAEEKAVEEYRKDPNSHTIVQNFEEFKKWMDEVMHEAEKEGRIITIGVRPMSKDDDEPTPPSVKKDEWKDKHDKTIKMIDDAIESNHQAFKDYLQKKADRYKDKPTTTTTTKMDPCAERAIKALDEVRESGRKMFLEYLGRKTKY